MDSKQQSTQAAGLHQAASSATTADDAALPSEPRKKGRASAAAGASASAPGDAQAQPKLWTPVFVLIIGFTLCCFIVGQGLNSGTSVYIDRMGGTATYAGVLAAVFSVAAAIARLMFGPVIDQRGRVVVISVGAVVLFAGTIAPAFVGNNMVLFTLCRFLQGVGFAAVTTASATAAADVLPLARLGEGIGYYGLGQALSMSVGPAIALFLVSTDPPENLFFGLSAAAAAVFVLSLLCRYERNPQKLPATAAYRRRWEQEHAQEIQDGAAAGVAGAQAPADSASSDTAPQAEDEPPARGIHRFFETRALPGALPMFILSPAYGFGIFFIGLYGTTLGVGNAGLFYTVSAVAMILVRLKSKSFMDSVLPIKLCTVAVGCGIVAYLMLLGAAASDLVYYTAGIFYGLSIGLSVPLNQTISVRNTPASRWGAANALYMLATDIGIGLSCILWGVINDSFGFPATICCVMGCIAASYVVAWIVYPADAKHAKQ